MYPNRDFEKKTITRLAKRGIRIVSSLYLPFNATDFTNAEVGYVLDNNGQSQIRRYGQVLALAK